MDECTCLILIHFLVHEALHSGIVFYCFMIHNKDVSSLQANRNTR